MNSEHAKAKREFARWVGTKVLVGMSKGGGEGEAEAEGGWAIETQSKGALDSFIYALPAAVYMYVEVCTSTCT